MSGAQASQATAQIRAALVRQLQSVGSGGISASKAKKIQALLRRGDERAQEREKQGAQWKLKGQNAHLNKVNDCAPSVKSVDAITLHCTLCFDITCLAAQPGNHHVWGHGQVAEPLPCLGPLPSGRALATFGATAKWQSPCVFQVSLEARHSVRSWSVQSKRAFIKG